MVSHLFFLGNLDAPTLIGGIMDNWTFGVTMMVCGMGGTILTLWIMSLIMSLMGKVFPYKKEGE